MIFSFFWSDEPITIKTPPEKITRNNKDFNIMAFLRFEVSGNIVVMKIENGILSQLNKNVVGDTIG
jgi:hypothetical protein